jgi:hypothetical protein
MLSMPIQILRCKLEFKLIIIVILRLKWAFIDLLDLKVLIPLSIFYNLFPSYLFSSIYFFTPHSHFCNLSNHLRREDEPDQLMEFLRNQ